MINSYDYELDYKNYLAKKELLTELSIIQLQYSGIILEADGEAKVRQLSTDSIMKYIRKIVGNIQEVWNKFKVGMEDKAWEKMKDHYSKAYQTDRPLIIKEVNENDRIPILDNIIKFINIENGQVDIEQLSKFENKEQVIKTLYPYFKDSKDGSKAELQEVINKNCFVIVKPGHTINFDALKKYMAFLDNYKKNAMKIAEDIKKINTTTNLIERVVKSEQQAEQQSAQQTSDQPTSESVIESVLESFNKYILELQFADQQDPDGIQLKNGSGKKSLAKDVTDFYQIFTMVLSLKMNTLNKAKNIAFRVCKSYGSNANKYLGISNEEKKEEKKETTNNPEGKTQVENLG